jgi:ornithine carbamoyltransferase
VQDVARVISGMCDGIMARTFEHKKITGLAKWSTVPVINGLTDYNHPCQAMADLMTLEEHFGSLKGRTMAFIGDGNNVARSLSEAPAARFGMRFILAAPPGYELPEADMPAHAQVPNLDFQTTIDPFRGRAKMPMRSTPTPG